MRLKGFDDYDVTIGDHLRGERATHGLHIEDAALKLALPVDVIEAIEQGRISDGKHEPMMLGFVRSYARLLELDPAELCAFYQRALGKQEGKKNRSAPLDQLEQSLLSLSPRQAKDAKFKGLQWFRMWSVRK